MVFRAVYADGRVGGTDGHVVSAAWWILVHEATVLGVCTRAVILSAPYGMGLDLVLACRAIAVPAAHKKKGNRRRMRTKCWSKRSSGASTPSPHVSSPLKENGVDFGCSIRPLSLLFPSLSCCWKPQVVLGPAPVGLRDPGFVSRQRKTRIFLHAKSVSYELDKASGLPGHPSLV